jgi:predicted metalloprotease
MDMRDQDESNNVEDARGSSGGGGFQFRPVHGIGIGTIVIALIGGWALGINPLQMLGLLSGTGTGTPVEQTAPQATDQTADQNAGSAAADDTEDPQKKFVRQIVRSTEVVWTDAFQQMGRSYENPKLLLFTDSYPTACGQGQAAAGPFYCPQDRTVYLDMGFFDLMTRQLHAPGQFAHAYVIGHEVGHHVQNLLGILGTVDAVRARSGAAAANALSVKIELQADCFAGVWARRAQQERGWRLEQGDIETALHAASQIGDDTLQKQAQGTVVPETFTHGTSAQRVSWFKRGIDSGDINSCDTFGTGHVAGTGRTSP